MRRRPNSRVTVRKATRAELKTLHKRTAVEIRWMTTPRSQLVIQERKEVSGSVGFGFDYGGKYWR